MGTRKPYQEYWTVRDICRHIPKHVYSYHRDHGTFPQPIPTLVGKARWKRETVEKWLKEYRERKNMQEQKRWKTINPMLRLFEDKDSGDYLLFPPAKGLALEWDGTLSHAFVFKPNEMVVAKEIGFTQCPDYPQCQICQSYSFNLKGFLAMYTEIER
jgi:hypothetical protein